MRKELGEAQREKIKVKEDPFKYVV